MIAVIQKVQRASVTIEGNIYSEISNGLVVLLGVEEADGDEDVDWLSKKVSNLRVFCDTSGVMNLSLKDVDGEMLIVSQFTLYASTKKGNRPSYAKAAPPTLAIPRYENFIQACERHLSKKVQTGVFGADMKLDLCNDGPVTIIIDTQDKK